MNKTKYPYTIEPNIIKLDTDYYRVLIKKGSGKNQKIFSEYVKGKITDARQVKRKGFAELENKAHFDKDKSKTTVYDFSKIWLDYCRKENLSPTTIQGYKQRLNNYILPFLAEYQLKKVNAQVIDELFGELKNQDKKTVNSNGEIEKLSSVSLNGVYRTLRNMLNKAVMWDYIEYNPISKVKCPSAKSIKEKESYNKSELFNVIKLLFEYNKKYGGMFILDCCTGARRCEINGLHIEPTKKHKADIDLNVELIKNDGSVVKGGMVYINRSVVFDKEKKVIVEREIPKTTKGIRGIPIPPFCVEAIKEVIRYRENEIKLLKQRYGDDIKIAPNLFLGKYGGIMHPDTLSHNWVKFREKYKEQLGNKHVTLHGVRHSFCSYMRNDGKNVISDKEIMDLMGHTDLKTTDVYTHSNREIADKVIEMWNDLEM